MYNPWTVIASNFKMQKKGKRAFSYSQCDPVKLTNGNVQLVYASLYPFEKGFYAGSDKVDKTKVVELINVIAKTWMMALMPWKIIGLIRGAITGFSGGANSVRDYFQSLLMRMPLRRINFFVTPQYDYYEELEKERLFLESYSGEQTRNKILITGLKKLWKSKWRMRRNHGPSLNATGTYRICSTFNEVEQTVEADEVAMVITIEGMHALGTDNRMDALFDRIQEIKRWPHPPFFITFAHHFDNGLCGHAHSLVAAATWFMRQKERMNAGFTSDGLKAARHLLGLNDSLEEDSTLGKRILVDLKHTAGRARKEYYEKIVGPCLEKGTNIPVILSHVGYSGWKTLDETIKYADDGEEDDDLRDGFYPWNINACGEDIEWAAKTNGLVGICLDQRILGGGTKHKEGVKEKVYLNIKAMLDVINQMPSPHREHLWDVLCLGTDFEGYVDPINDYAEALDFKLLRNDLIDFISELRTNHGDSYYFPPNQSDTELADKICFTNAYDFLKRNL